MIYDSTQLALLRAVQDNPLCPIVRGVLADYLEEHGDEKRAEVLRKGNIPLTDFDLAAVSALGRCDFAPGTFDKRFARHLVSRATVEPGQVAHLTPKQWLWLWVLLRRYRRSVRNARVLNEAEERYNRSLELLNIGWLKPNLRRLTKRHPEPFVSMITEEFRS